MLLYVAHLPGVPMSGIFSKAAAQVCEARDLDTVLRLFLPAAVTAMTREDAVEMGERRLGGNPNARKLFFKRADTLFNTAIEYWTLYE